jgi:hypothetical protein
VQIGFEFGERVTLHGVYAHDNFYNIHADIRFEYVTATNCYGYQGRVGIAMLGGNNSWLACHFENNLDNCQLGAGENNAHGQFVGCSFNHAADGGYGLNATNVTNGQTFTGCAFWYAPIRLNNCIGISIRNSQIAGNPIVQIIDGGLNSIDDNWTPNGLTKTFTGVTFTSFRRNRTTKADNSPEPGYRDVVAEAVNSNYGYPLPWNATSDTTIPLIYSLKKWNGMDAGFLQSGAGDFYCPQAGYYTIEARVHFDAAGAAERPVLKVRHLSADASTVLHTEWVAMPAAISETENALRINTRIFMANGELIRVLMRSKTATGIVVQAGGIRVFITSAD